MFKKHHFILFISVFFIFDIFAQNFIVRSDFENLNFRNEINHVENGFAQLKLLEDEVWLSYSPENLRVFFEAGESKYISLNLSEKEYIQTELCCYPTKGEVYSLKVSSRLSQYSRNGLTYIKAYLLSKPYIEGEKAEVRKELILNFNDSLAHWQYLEADFIASGEERYLLIGVMEEIEGEIILNLNPKALEDAIAIDLASLSLQLSSNQQGLQKASEKVEF